MLRGHWSQGILLSFIPVLIYWLYTIVFHVHNYFGILILSLLGMWLSYGVAYACLAWHRAYQKDQTTVYRIDQPIMAAFKVWTPEYFGTTISILLLTSLFEFLWSLLFIIPGIIKGYAYSQAFLIYYEHVLAGEHVGALQCITESRQLMKGHKWEYFVYSLSFLGWAILASLSFGIGFFWLVSYETITYAGYFDNLIKNQPHHQPLSTVDEAINVEKQALNFSK